MQKFDYLIRGLFYELKENEAIVKIFHNPDQILK